MLQVLRVADRQNKNSRQPFIPIRKMKKKNSVGVRIPNSVEYRLHAKGVKNRQLSTSLYVLYYRKVLLYDHPVQVLYDTARDTYSVKVKISKSTRSLFLPLTSPAFRRKNPVPSVAIQKLYTGNDWLPSFPAYRLYSSTVQYGVYGVL